MVGAGTTHTGQTIVAAGITELATLRVNDAGSRHGRFSFLSGIEAGSRLQFESRLWTHLLALAALHAHDDARLTSCRKQRRWSFHTVYNLLESMQVVAGKHRRILVKPC